MALLFPQTLRLRGRVGGLEADVGGVGGASQPLRNAHRLQGACALQAGLQGLPPAHFAEGEAETQKDWDTCQGWRPGGGLGSYRPGFKCAYAYPHVTTAVPQFPHLRGWGP